MKTQLQQRQRGLSMIEMLVALALSSFIILGITQVYIDNKRSYTFQQAQVTNQENSRFSILIMEEFLNKAGYRRSVHQLLEDAFPQKGADGKYCAKFDDGAVLGKLLSDSDRGFCIRYQPAFSGELDCQGNAINLTHDQAFAPVPASESVTLAFKFDETTGSLQCANVGTDTGYASLVEGIVDFEIDFAVGNTDILNKKIAQYISVTSWNDQSASGVIRGIRYQALFAGMPNQRVGESAVLNEWKGPNKDKLLKEDRGQVYQVSNGNKLIRNMVL